jgi:hypothetical protein
MAFVVIPVLLLKLLTLTERFITWKHPLLGEYGKTPKTVMPEASSLVER